MLIFVVPSDMSIIDFKRKCHGVIDIKRKCHGVIDFKRKCNGVELYCFVKGEVRREGEHFRVTRTPKASKEWQSIETEKVLTWVIRRLGWRVCMHN